MLLGCRTPAPPHLARPFDVATATATARAFAAEYRGMDADRLVFEGLTFPLASLLPRDQDALVIMLDLDQRTVEENDGQEITTRTSVQVAIRPDGSPRWNGVSTGRSTRPAQPARRQPKTLSHVPVIHLPDLDYVELALAAVSQHVPARDRRWLMPFGCRFEYHDLTATTPDLRYIVIQIFDPRDITIDPKRNHETVNGHAVYITPDGQVTYRGRMGFGSTPRFGQIAELLKARGEWPRN